MKNINALPCDINYLKNLSIINNYLDNNKDNIFKFFIQISKNNENNLNNENNILDKIISQDFINLISKNNIKITKKQIWKDIKKIYNLSSNSRIFLQKLYKKYGMGIFIILNYYEYYQHIIFKTKYSLDFNILMQIPNDFINNINVIEVK